MMDDTARERWYFVPLLTKMFNDVGMVSSDLNAIKDLRDESSIQESVKHHTSIKKTSTIAVKILCASIYFGCWATVVTSASTQDAG